MHLQVPSLSEGDPDSFISPCAIFWLSKLSVPWSGNIGCSQPCRGRLSRHQGRIVGGYIHWNELFVSGADTDSIYEAIGKPVNNFTYKNP